MRILHYSYETTLHMSEAVSDHDFILRCQPTSTHAQTVLDAQTIITPQTTLSQQVDGFGNLLQVGRIETPHDVFGFLSSGLVMVDAAEPHRVVAHPMYKRASQLTGNSKELQAFADDLLRVCPNATPQSKAEKLSHAVYEHMSYTPGATSTDTDAATAFAQGSGVCQDYTHILIALLRGQGIAARYVNGLMVGEGATHAWVEFHDGTRWHGIDPTNDRLVDDGYITISHGRDFADCPIESGVFRGGARQSQSVSVVVNEQS